MTASIAVVAVAKVRFRLCDSSESGPFGGKATSAWIVDELSKMLLRCKPCYASHIDAPSRRGRFHCTDLADVEPEPYGEWAAISRELEGDFVSGVSFRLPDQTLCVLGEDLCLTRPAPLPGV